MSLEFQLQPGVQAFPGYCLHLPLGRGGCGEVWEASGPEGQSIALKFMRVRDTSAATRESKSIQAIRGLRHPYLIRIEQVFLQPGYVVIAMEVAEGSLMDLLEAYNAERGTPVPVSEVLGYLSDAAQAIDFLNTKQHYLDGRQVAYQHCDIKPSNLLIVGGHCKLADFGLATSVTTSLTRTFSRTGTLEFAAPEVYRGQLSDQSDQYALAVTYCLLRGGQLPFPDSPTKFMATYTRPTPDLTMIPTAERPIIARALSLSPVQRWPSCAALITQLKRVNEPAAAPRRAFA